MSLEKGPSRLIYVEKTAEDYCDWVLAVWWMLFVVTIHGFVASSAFYNLTCANFI